jgi:Asp-tRNA(Asn)/Glu-tRNA(Gln) amidotransferase C subunit
MAKVTKSLKADRFLSSPPSSEGDYGSGGGEDSDVDESSDDLLNKIDDLVINDRLIRFRLATPTPMPSYLNVHFICETASRLLFLSVHWVRSIPAFSLLSYDTQVALVRNAWSDIFVLGMAQCAQTMNLQNILSSIVSHLQTSVSQDKLSATRVRQVTTTICKIQEYVRALNKLNVDDWEFAYLKAISLFGADKLGISSARQLDKIRDKTVEELKEYCLKDNNNSSSNISNEDEEEKMDFRNTHTTSTTGTSVTSISHDHPGLTRFSDLLLRLSPLRSLQPDVLEELFFAGLIGNVQIDSVVPYILKMEASEYQTSPFVKDDIKIESDIDTGKSKMDVVNEERISVDTYSTKEKEDQN